MRDSVSHSSSLFHSDNVIFEGLVLLTSQLIPWWCVCNKGDNIKRGSHISLSWFSCGFPILVELEFGVLVFVEGGKPENPEKFPPAEQGENQRQTRPPYGSGRTWVTLVEGERSHHFPVPTHPEGNFKRSTDMVWEQELMHVFLQFLFDYSYRAFNRVFLNQICFLACVTSLNCDIIEDYHPSSLFKSRSS